MVKEYKINISCIILLCLAFVVLVAPAMAATTQVQIVKYANDGTTVLASQTVNYSWMAANLPVWGDGTTHYYAQGPVFVDDLTNETHEQELRWNPAEDTNVLEKDMGAVKGTNLKDLCDIVGGMSQGERLKILSSDGWSRWFAYKNVYQYTSREGPIGICWYKNGNYPGTSFPDGMRMVWFADDSVNTLGPGGTGVHAFGNFDWHEVADPEYWYYYQSGSENYPTTTGISGQYVNRIYIYSNEAPPVAPAAAFSGTPQSGNAPLTVQFTDGSIGPITGYAWDFNNDGTTDSTAQSPSFQYTTPGTYTVKLTVTGPGGTDDETKTNYISVSSPPAAPVATFIGTPLSGNAPLTVQFTDASIGSITGYAWDFNNDGTTDSVAQSPSFQYTMPGTYTVKLTVTGPSGSDDEVKTNYVTVSSSPSPEYSLILTGDHTVTLTKTQIESILSSGQNVSYTDTTNGRTWNGIPLWYLVSAVDDSDTGFNFNATRAAMNYQVQVRAGDGFSKNFTSSAIAGSSNYIIANTLNGSAIPFTDPTNSAKLWWPLKSVGSSMTGGNSVGNLTEIRLIGLPVLPMADFTATPLTGIAPLTVKFTDTSTGTAPLSYAWDFDNDGTTDSTVQNPSYAYAMVGSYTVKLTVTNTEGIDSEVKTDYITVLSPASTLLWGPYLTSTTTTGTVINSKTDIATSMTVEYATDAYFTAHSAYDQSATDGVSTQLHHIALSGLSPDTKYHYRVVFDGQATGDLHFRTFPSSGAFTFVMYSDTQDQLPTYSQLERHKLVADRIAQESNVAFVLNSGDLVNDAANLSDWDRYFAAGSMMMANTTVYPALGNHDDNDPNYFAAYGVPSYYSFDCGDGHVAVLDSNDWAWSDFPTQSAWLANDLQTTKPFKFTSFHYPPYSSDSRHFGGWENIREEWEDDFNANNVLAVFNGHVHAYERFLVNDTNYFVAGIGGGPSYNLATPRAAGSVNSLEYMIGYIRVTVNPAAGTATAQVIRVADVSADLKSVTTVYPPGTVFETVVMNLAALPVANFTATPLSGNAPLAVQFTDTSTGTPTTWAWDFDNDGITDNTTRSPSYTYATAGTYTVNLTVTNSVGSDSEVKTGFITASSVPVVDTIFDGTVTLTTGDTFTVQAYNNATGIYTVNRTTPLGALDAASKISPGLAYNVTDKRWQYDQVVLLDDVGNYVRKNPGYWYAYVNGVYKDGYGNHADGLNVIQLSNNDQVNFYYSPTNDPANATAVVKIKSNIAPPSSAIDTLFDGTVILAPGETFTKQAYNNATGGLYTINRTTPLGALDVAASNGGFTYDVTDSRYSYDQVLLLDNVDKYLYNKSQKWNWLAYVNNVYKDGYGNHANGLDVIELSNGDHVEFYYVQETVDKTNLTAVKEVTLAAVKTVVNIAGSPPSTPDWTLPLSGAKTASVTKTFFEQGLACPSSGHQVNWTDTDGNIWGGVPLWLLVGMIDDNPDVGPDHYNFNDSIAAQGYSVKVSSGDGWDTTLASADIARNNGYIVANTLNGQPLPINLTSGKLSWPLHLKGSAVFGGQQVGNITKIELTGLPQPPTEWTLTLEGEVTDTIPQSYFIDAIACHHNVTWTDTSGNVWQGVSLWDLAGAVDDTETSSHYTFNDSRAATGYTIRVSAADGFNATFASADVAHNDGFFVAYKMNGVPLTGSDAPLKLVGPDTTSGKQRIGGIVKISLEGLPDQYSAGDWQLNLVGKISDEVPQGEFEYWTSCHSATYTDANGNVYTGIPLWRLMGWVDDRIPHGPNGFNDAAATAGYKVIVKAGDGYAKEFNSQQIGKNDNFIVANTMNGAPLSTDGEHPPYPVRLVGNGATGGNSVGNIVEIQLTDFQTPVDAPKLHIVKYGSDGTTVINETTIDYHFMESTLPVIGDGITHYQYQGVTFDPADLWDPTETKGMNPPKIDNAIKGTKVKDLVELVGGMGTGTDILFVSSDGYETHMGYSNIYTNPYVQSHQGDAIIAWYADGQYVPQYADGMRFMFTPDDHVFGQWDMHEAMDEKYWHYYWSDNIQYPSAAGTSAKYVTEIKVYSSLESDWQLELDGSDIGGIKTNISKTYLEQALACQFGANHKATYTDNKGNVWEGMPLWFFAGFVDDADQHSDNAFNNSLATAGYRVVITAGDGYNTTIDSTKIIRNSNYIVANSLNGSHIAETDSNWPLRLTGVNVTGGSVVKNISSIRLLKSLQAPTSAFIADPVSGDAPLLVQFTDQSTGTGPLAYAWDFDNDGITDNTTQSPSYTYATAGTYTVNLTVTNGAGVDTEVRTDYISVTAAPAIDEWSITLNGVGSEQLTRVNFEALAEGNRLTFTDASGTWSGIALWRILARVDDNDPATFSDGAADLGYSVTVAAADGYSKMFTSSALKRNDSYIVADTLNGAPLPKVDGTKNVWPLKIVGSAPTSGQKVGNISQITLSDFVAPPESPAAAFTSDVQTGVAPLTVQFTDQSTGTGPLTYAWDFDNNGITDNTTQSPSYTYSNAGTYTVNLTVTNAAGVDTEIKTDYISVTAAPVVDEWSITLNGVGSEQLTRVNFEALAEGNRLTFTDASGTWSGIALWRILARVDDNDPATFSDGAADLGYSVTVAAADGYSKMFTSSALKRNDSYIVADTLNGASLPKVDGTKNVWPLKIVGSAPSSGQKVGNISQITLSDFVAPPESPAAAFTSDVQTGMAPLTVQFTDQSTGTGPLTCAWDFDNDGTVDSTVETPSFTYAAAGTYTVKLTVTGPGGSDDEVKADYISVTTAPLPPVAVFSSDVQTGMAPLIVQFTDQSTGTGPLTCAWDFDNDGSVDSTEQNPSHTFNAAGTYTVKLTVSGAGGSDDEVKADYISVTAAPAAPVAVFTSDVQTGTSPLTVNFTDQSTGSPTSWFWNFGDGKTSTKQNPVHTYTTARWPQTYTVTLTVTNAMGSDRITKTRYITVTPAPAPAAEFTANVTSGTSPLSVRFTDQSTGCPTLWFWNFGDGTFSMEQNPDHTYTNARWPQTYTVTLTVVNLKGFDRITKTRYITVTPVPAPAAEFTANVTSGTSPLAVRFTDQSTGNPTSWFWTFGDGSTSTEQNPDHSYTTSRWPQTYTVTLKVSNSRGSDRITKTRYITVTPAPVYPVAEFISYNRVGFAPLTVKFMDRSTGTAPLSYAWDFDNDGKVDSTMQNPTYTYSSSGTFSVNLTVTGPGGTDAEVKAGYIIVNAVPVKPMAIFTSDTQSGASPLTVQFTDQSTGSPTSWYWNFGDGSISTKQNPVHTYTTTRWTQTYTVTLTVTNANGFDRTVKTRYITVTPPPGPEAGFIASSTTGRSPLAVQFTDQSTGHPTSWFWTFGDGTYSTKQNPDHTYRSLKNSQYYTVTLTVSNERGTDRLTRTGYINIVNNPPITILLE